jgi:NADH dehydrogenase FAD-containing subunit
MDRLDARVGQHAERVLASRGVRVLLGERITDWGRGDAQGAGGEAAAGPVTLRTDKGTEVKADLVLSALGVKPATAAFLSSLGDERLGAGGAVAVEPTLQVPRRAGRHGSQGCLPVPVCAALCAGGPSP